MDLMSVLKEAGFRGQGLKMAYAIAMAESTGNASAHNTNADTGDNSYGLFQINMLGNMGPARRKQYGLSSNDDLFDPLTNAKVAFKMSNGGANWGPWSTYGSGAYKQYYGGSGATVSNAGSSSSSSSYSEEEVKKLSKGEMAENYGYVESLMDSNPELKKLFEQAVKAQWTDKKFQAELRDTKWWKSHSQTERDFLVLKFGDPKTADQKLDQAYVRVRQLANQLGIHESDANLRRMRAWAYNVAAKGWDETTLRNQIGKYITIGAGAEGEAGEHLIKFKGFAYDMGVTMAGGWYADKIRAVSRGLATEQDVMDSIRKQAKTLFPEYSKQIDAGQTMADIASPYIQSMQSILEVPAGSLGVNDKTIKSALQNKNKQTGANQVMPLWQFENQLRNDPRWRKTQNAQNSLMQVAHQVLSDFGVAY